MSTTGLTKHGRAKAVDAIAEQFDEPVASNEAVGQKRFPVIEIFGPTIQGEGQVIGYQTLFVRFGGCDYKCRKCDSLHAVIPEMVKANATYMTANEIVLELEEKRAATGVKWVTLSGGNPAIHNLSYLVNKLKALGWRIQVETQATHYRNWISMCDAIVLSPKSPGMGENFDPVVYKTFIKDMGIHDNAIVKVVVFSAADIEFALSVFELTEAQPLWYQSRNRPWKYLSLGNPMPPIWKTDSAARIQGVLPSFTHQDLLEHYDLLLQDILNDKRTKDCVVLPQMHVLLWGNKQGV